MNLREIADALHCDCHIETDPVPEIYSIRRWPEIPAAPSPNVLVVVSAQELPQPVGKGLNLFVCGTTEDALMEWGNAVSSDRYTVREACQEVSRLLAGEIAYANAANQLISAVIRGVSLQRFIDICAQVMENDVIFSGKDTELLARSDGEYANSVLWQEHGKMGRFSESTMASEDFLQLSDELRNSQGPVFLKKKISPYSSLASNVELNGVNVGVVSVLDTRRPLEKQDLKLVDLISGLLSNYVHPEDLPINAMLQYQSRLIQSLLEDVGERVLDTQTATTVLRLNEGYRVLAICKDTDGDATPLPSVIPLLAKLLPQQAIVNYASYAVIIDRDDACSIQWKKADFFQPFLERHGLRMGISRVAFSSEQLKLCFQQATQAIDLGRLMDPDRRCFSYERYAQIHLWQQLSAIEDLRVYCNPGVLALIENDACHNTDYFHTLDVYLRSNCNQSSAASALGLHKSTLRYRLEKIQELAGLDFAAPFACASLGVTIQILEVLDKMDKLSADSRKEDRT